MTPGHASRPTELERSEYVVETGLTYDGIVPVRIRVTRRGDRFEFSDDGGAVAAADVDPARVSFVDRVVMGAFSANVSRRGVVWLPGFARSDDQWLAELPRLVADGSLALYGALLELED